MSFSPSNKATSSTPSSLSKTEREQHDARKLQRRQLLIRVGVIAAVLAFSLLILINSDKLRNLGNYGYVGVFLLSFLTNATIFVPAPSWIIPIIPGTTFNPFIVGLLVGTGESLGEVTGFIAGASGRIIVEDRERYQWLSDLANRYGLPIAPQEMPLVGQGKIFVREVHNRKLAVATLVLIILLLYAFIRLDWGYRIFTSGRKETTSTRPEKMV